MNKVNPFVVKYQSGPRCEGCPFRKWSLGFAPPQGAEFVYRKGEWVEYELGSLYQDATYMFIGKYVAREESLKGQNLVGPSGNWFNELMQEAGIRRSQCVLTNVVKCRPIVWKPCKGKGCKSARDGMLPHLQDHGDVVNADPSVAQIHECTERYLEEEIEAFQGRVLVGMGPDSTIPMLGHRRSVGKYLGTKWEHGPTIECPRCGGGGEVPGGVRNCPVCKGKTYVNDWAEHSESCQAHPTYTGKVKPQKKAAHCPDCWEIWHLLHPWCPECSGRGKTLRPPKACPTCHGACEIPEDPNQEFVAKTLKPDQLFYLVYNPAYLQKAPEKWETMRVLWNRLPTLHEELQIEKLKDYDLVPGFQKVQEFLNAEKITFDFETTGLEDDAQILLMGVARKPLEAISITEGHSLFKDFLIHPRVTGQNVFQFDYWLAWKHYGILPPEKTFDTRMAGHLLNPDTPNDLTYLTLVYARPAAAGYWKTQQNYAENKDLVACIDVDMTTRVENGQTEQLEDQGLLQHFWNETIPVAHVAFHMRRRGLRFDRPLVSEIHDKLVEFVQEKRDQLPDWGGTGTEHQSAKVITHLYETLKLPERRDRKTQKLTSNKTALMELRSLIETVHPSTDHLTEDQASEALAFIDLIDTLRDRSKLLTFVQPDNIPFDGFVHPKWNSVGTATMRWSVSGKFNPMVLPKRRGDIRRIIIGDEPGWEIMTADISQAEVCGFLWAAEEWRVLDQVLREGLDAHALMASEMGFIKSLDENSPGYKEGRDKGKTATFAYIYGEAPRTSAMRTGIPLHEINQIREHYVEVFPGIPAFRELYISEAIRHGYVTSPFGTKRHIRVHSPIGRGANQAANAPIQSIPPHVVRRGMVKLHRELPAPARLILNVHDELTVTYPRELRDEVATAITDVLRTPVPELPALPIGMGTGLVFNIDIKVGENWGELKKLEYEGGKWICQT